MRRSCSEKLEKCEKMEKLFEKKSRAKVEETRKVGKVSVRRSR